MAVGERLKYFRKRKKLTQKEVGEYLGYIGNNSFVRIAQYESEIRIPKADTTSKIAELLDVSPQAIKVPNIDSLTGLMYTLFALEDMYGLNIDCIDGKVCLCPTENSDLESRLEEWSEQARKMRNGEISKEEYDNWRYKYTEPDTAGSADAAEANASASVSDSADQLEA